MFLERYLFVCLSAWHDRVLSPETTEINTPNTKFTDYTNTLSSVKINKKKPHISLIWEADYQ